MKERVGPTLHMGDFIMHKRARHSFDYHSFIVDVQEKREANFHPDFVPAFYDYLKQFCQDEVGGRHRMNWFSNQHPYEGKGFQFTFVKKADSTLFHKRFETNLMLFKLAYTGEVRWS